MGSAFFLLSSCEVWWYILVTSLFLLLFLRRTRKGYGVRLSWFFITILIPVAPGALGVKGRFDLKK